MLAAADPPSRILAAAGAIAIYAVTIAFTDNFVRHITPTHGLWQFQLTRTVMAAALVALMAPFLPLDLRPKRWPPVIVRSLLHGLAILLYFGSLAFLPVAMAVAGLFTAPIFVLLISRFAFGRRIGPVRILAVTIGFSGAVLALGMQDGGAVIHPMALLPVVAAALYALGNIATREWCAGESAGTLTLGFFAALGLFGALGILALSLWQAEVPGGAEGFILRGWIRPTPLFLGVTLLQAAGSLLAVVMMVRAYQLADASRVAVFEYLTLPASAFWSWALWGELLSLRAIVGMALIFLAGLIIAARGR